MTPERWKEIEKIFMAALELEPTGRSAFLEESCAGDEVLRAEVETLLAADETQPRSGLLAHLLSQNPDETLVGQQIRHFVVLEELGRGQVGRVYRAQDTNLDRNVALKFVSTELIDNDQYLRRFKQEAQTACKLKHENIVEIYGLEQEGNKTYIVMQYVEGITLRKLLEKNLEIGEVLRISIQVASALEHAHSKGVVHRDIKPENIMLQANGGPVKVLDFGIAKIIREISQQAKEQENSTSGVKTVAGMLLGTVRYMSPEQAAADDELDARSDIWSLGVLIYEMITHRAPFEGQTNPQVFAKIHAKEPLPLSHFRKEVPVELQRIVSTALAKNREERYQRISELRNDLLGLCRELGFGNEVIEQPEDLSSDLRDLEIRQEQIVQQSGTTIGSALPTNRSIDLAIEIRGKKAVVYRNDRGSVVTSEPSLVAINRLTNNIEAVGKRAEDLLLDPESEIQILEPMKDMRVSDSNLAEKILGHLINEALVGESPVSARIMMAVPLEFTQVQRRALVDATYCLKAAGVYLAERPVCAALGLGLPLHELHGHMIVHISEAATEIIAIWRSQWISLKAINVGGSAMEEAIREYIRRKYNVLIGEGVAETIQLELGSAYPVDDLQSREVRGHELLLQVSRTITITNEEVNDALAYVVSAIVNGVGAALERATPELSADIAERGIVLTGRGALLKNLVKRLAVEMHLPVFLAEDPVSCVVTGAARMLSDFKLMAEKRSRSQEHKLIYEIWTTIDSGVRRLANLLSADVAIDMGTDNTLVYAKGRGIVVSEPSIVAVKKTTNRVVAVGRDAKDMLGRTPEDIIAIHPMKSGVVVNSELAGTMLRYFIRKAHNNRRWVSPRVVIPIHSDLSKVERRAFIDSAYRANAADVCLVRGGMMAAIGSGLPVTEPHGNMVVDIGAGITDIVVISLNGIVYWRAVDVAGNEMVEAIIQYIKRKYNLLIGIRTAEAVKIELGSAWPLDEPLSYEVRGRNLKEGIPKTIVISDEEVLEALQDSLLPIINAVRVTLDRTPPELSADIIERGIVLTGGGSLLKNLDKRLSIETGLPVSVSDDPLVSVILGAGKLLSHPDLLNHFRLDDAIVV